VRAGPFDAPLTGLVLKPNEVFMVHQEVVGMDGRVYLCLADGCGWVFDDTKLMPQDPSVVRCTYTAQAASMFPPPQHLISSASPSVPQMQSPQNPIADMMLLPVHAMHPSLRTPNGGELLASTPAGMAPAMVGFSGPLNRPSAPSGYAAVPSPLSSFQVAYPGGIHLLVSPAMQAGTGAWLPHNETFSVSEEVTSADGRVYLRLCDGRGWAFDDSALIPRDPSVRRLSWMSYHPSGQQMSFSSQVLDEFNVDAFSNRRRRMYPQPRGKRGGKRCSKRKQAAAAASTGVE